MWRVLRTVAIAIGSLGSSGLLAQDRTSTESLQPLKVLLRDKKAILLDVREKEEWDESHLRVAVPIPTSLLLDPDRRQEAVRELDREKTIYCHCLRGGRAKKCARILQEMGFDCRPLVIDYEELVDAGFEVVYPRSTSSD